MTVPYILIAVFVFCIATFGFEEFSKSSIALSTVVREVKEENDASNDKFERLTYVDQDFPTLTYLKVWSLLNVDGWSKKDIPVYYGDTNSILMKGAGMWDGSNFCGQNGCTVISGHVTTYFREIENTEVGTRVIMDTVYGTYTYEVSRIEIFSPGKGAELFLSTFDTETLILYTCYPYNSRNRTQRIALVCSKVEGKAFRDYAS
ncbi:MAG: class D sortase [Acutalibacteraceae bacterium]